MRPFTDAEINMKTGNHLRSAVIIQKQFMLEIYLSESNYNSHYYSNNEAKTAINV